jgi:hypothetical protein
MSKTVRRTLLVVALLALGVVFLGIVVPSVRLYRMQKRRVQCLVNAQFVAMQLQSNAALINWDAPDPIGQLVALKILDPNQSRCPDGKHAYQVNVAAFRTPLGKMPYPPSTVILYEPLDNHEGIGGAVIFADGHGEWVSAANMPRVLK